MIKKLKLIARRLLILIINLLFCIISVLFKRKSDLYIVGGGKGKKFGDNSMYFFLFLANFTEKRAIWISKNKEIINLLNENNYEAYYCWSVEGMFYSLNAKYHIIDVYPFDVNAWCSIGAVKLNLWHGIPLKRIQNYAKHGTTEELTCRQKKKNQFKTSFIGRILFKMISPGFWSDANTYVLSTSEYLKPIFSYAFGTSPKKVLIANYPRNEVQLNRKNERFLIDKNIKEHIGNLKKVKENGYTVVSYFPTWRETKKDLFLGVRKRKEFEKIYNFLVENSIVLLTKFHPCVDKEYYGVDVETKFYLPDIKNKNNIITLPEIMDVNPFLMYTELLITDYSGIIFDYLLQDKPIIFYPYDMEEYIKVRGFILNYEEVTPGEHVNNIDQLINAISDFLGNKDEYSDRYKIARHEVRNKMFDTMDGSDRILKLLENIK